MLSVLRVAMREGKHEDSLKRRKEEGTTCLAVGIAFQSRLEQCREFFNVTDQELEDRLAQGVLGRQHSMIGMRDDSRLEDDRQICEEGQR